MITKYDTGQIVYVPVKIDKAFQVEERLLYTIRHGDYIFKDPILETSLKEENGKVILEIPKAIDKNIFFENRTKTPYR